LEAPQNVRVPERQEPWVWRLVAIGVAIGRYRCRKNQLMVGEL